MTCIFFRLHTLIIRHARIFAAVGVATFCPLNHARAASVTQMFKEALKSYDSGNLRLATKLLYDIVKKYPTHEPSHLLLGRINYRQGQMVRAAFHFRKTSPDFLEGEAAYEYGITFFARGECKEAEAGLKRVGPGFRGANLAAFYRGICFSRNREWFRAELQLEKAINLPEHLIGVRRRLLTQVREAQQEERSRPIDTPPQSYSFQPVVVVPPPPADLALSEKEAKERRTPAKTAAKKDTTKPGLTISLAPNIVLGISSTDSDFNGAKRNRSDKNSITLGAELTLKQLFAPTKNGDQPSLSLPAKFSYKSDDIQGKTSVTKAYEDAIDQPFDVTTNDPKKSLRVLKASTTPEVSVPVFKAVDLIGKGQFELTNVQEEEVPSSQGYGGSGSAVITQGPISLTAFGEYMQFQITSRKEPNHTGFVRLKGSLSPEIGRAHV